MNLKNASDGEPIQQNHLVLKIAILQNILRFHLTRLEE